ncbi:PAS domain-containing hybrid sensor histidine kinase/response regulator [Legionella jordanis]|uniref:histidine kinase n=1 Tax=Legionella jordanis TaxID=456 RepID=A0A0W0VEA1_9GAMM|nr:PAS domain-containing sensor histidine kinase [Legionella jordanis]KTD18431.1 sensory box histidine kinase/response regulator [Legionella jordanis]RMX05336.1 PAS domain-containing sensor histidine kinase [Legionella jordanis]VEH13221.1 sensory box histidine kinase/response regulator [Legionella jordanis]
MVLPKKQREDFANQDNLTNTIIDYLPAQIFWKNKSLTYVGCNMAFVNSLGLHSKEEVIGKSDFELPVSEENSQSYRADDRKIIENKESRINIEECQRLTDGTERILSTSKVPLINKNGEVTGVLGIYIDITDRIKMEKSLAKAKEQAELSNRAKTEFITNMSHDIRTPVSGIIGISKLLEERLEDPEEKQYAHWVHESGEQLLSLLNSVLDIIAASQSTENRLVEEEFDLYQSIKNLIHLELPTVKLKQLDLDIDFDPAIRNAIITDRTKLVRILLNLIGNAIKFTDKGKIGIQVKKISDANDEQLLEFVIWDTGIGIPAELQQQVFERFFRVNPSYKGKYDGHGVGLHIVRNYLELLDSKIQLESEPTVGTRISFNLKVKRGKILPAFEFMSEEKDSQEPKPLFNGKANILLVEDNTVALRIAESLITQLGYHCTSTMDAEEAMKLIEVNRYDLIITDIGLPTMSGQELTHWLRSLPQNHKNYSIPVVGLTAHAVEKIEEECLQAGMNKILTKPLSRTTLQEIVSSFLAPAPHQEQQFLGSDLPNTETGLFELQNFPLLDANIALSNSGSKAAMREILELLLFDNLQQEESALRKAHADNNWTNAEKIAHKLKSSALYCGTVKLQYACQYFERYCKAGYSKRRQDLFEQLLTVIAETKIAIKSWLSSSEQ